VFPLDSRPDDKAQQRFYLLSIRWGERELAQQRRKDGFDLDDSERSTNADAGAVA